MIVVLGVVALAPAVGADSPWIAGAFLVAVSLGAIVADPGLRWTVLRLTRVVSPGVVLMGLSDADATGRELLIPAAVASAFSLVAVLAELMLDRRAPRGPSAGRGLAEVVGGLTAGIRLLPAIVVTVMVTDGTKAPGTQTHSTSSRHRGSLVTSQFLRSLAVRPGVLVP